LSESLALPFQETYLLLAHTRLTFSILENPTNIWLIIMAKMLRLALKNEAVSWPQLEERGLTHSKLYDLEKRLGQVPLTT